jgi:hypothetical protein
VLRTSIVSQNCLKPRHSKCGSGPLFLNLPRRVADQYVQDYTLAPCFQRGYLSRMRTTTQVFTPGTFNLMRYTLVLAVM